VRRIVAFAEAGDHDGDDDGDHDGDGYDDRDDDRDDRDGDRDDDRDDDRDGDQRGPDRIPDDRVLPSVGQLFHSDGSCSATVITSESEQLALTAAHCVYTPERIEEGSPSSGDTEPGWADDVKFQPGRSGDDAPHGTWPVEEMWVDERWQNTGNRRYDVAVLRIGKQDGKTIQDVVGAQGIDFSAGAHDSVVALGYPAGPRSTGLSSGVASAVSASRRMTACTTSPASSMRAAPEGPSSPTSTTRRAPAPSSQSTAPGVWTRKRSGCTGLRSGRS
jgi:hypothetical protein